MFHFTMFNRAIQLFWVTQSICFCTWLIGTDSEKAKQDYINNVKELIATLGLKA